MNPNRYLLLCLFFIAAQIVGAQDHVVHLSADMFKPHQRIFLAPIDGWMFHQGHNPNWANPNMEVSDWQKMSLAAISPDQEDETGRIEGWFRL